MKLLRVISVHQRYLILQLILQYSMWPRIQILTMIQLQVFGNQLFKSIFSVDLSGNCIDFSLFYPIMVNGHNQMGGQDDGLVPIGSAEPPQFHTLGETHKCHTNLLDENAYNLAFPILIQ